MAETSGIKQHFIQRLEALVGHQMEDGVLLDTTVLDCIVELTQELGREVLVMSDSKNRIYHVEIGDAASVALSDRGATDRRRRLNAIRVIHTHPNGVAFLSEEDYSAAENLSVECMVAVGVPARKGTVRFGVGVPVESDGALKYAFGICQNLNQLNHLSLQQYIASANAFLKKQAEKGFDAYVEMEKALLIGIETTQNRKGIAIEHSMEELARLVETAGGTVIQRVIQKKDKADPVFYIGRGKLLDIKKIIQNNQINLIVSNDELNANQIACIEGNTGIKTIDRTTLILDIFARQAKTKEGKLQVELAQQKYRLSHLKGLGIVLSRTGGGIGTRGPGEKKLETDRRHIRRQIDELERKLAKITKTNQLNAKRRSKNSIPTVALVGYTNSGKSTLFNRLTDSEVVMKNALFVTLDSTMRKINPIYGDYLLSDTVGFIEKLPHELIKAFKTTLMEVESADLLLHVVDASDSDSMHKIEVVNQVISDIGAGRKDSLIVYNKMDRLTEEKRIFYQNLAERKENAVCISAKKDEGISTLTDFIQKVLQRRTEQKTFVIPYEDSHVLQVFHQYGQILKTEYHEEGAAITVEVPETFPLNRYTQYLIEKEETE